ncbi:MAG: stage II sporulation protein E, partial [Pseudodesulfovibrio sp.]
MKMGSFSLRALAYHVLAVLAGTVYGAQVCPLLTRMPSWTLGLTIFLPLAAAFFLRGPAERLAVAPAPPLRRAARQFRMELTLFTLAGLASALGLLPLFGPPFLESGMKLAVGLFTVGVFASLDLALSRERAVIEEARRGLAAHALPTRLTPMTRTVSLAAVLILLLVTVIIMLVLVRDMGLIALQGPAPESAAAFTRSVILEVAVVIAVLLVLGINLVFSYARNLRLLFAIETDILESVSRGDLSRLVPVTTNNELGVIAGHT